MTNQEFQLLFPEVMQELQRYGWESITIPRNVCPHVDVFRHVLQKDKVLLVFDSKIQAFKDSLFSTLDLRNYIFEQYKSDLTFYLIDYAQDTLVVTRGLTVFTGFSVNKWITFDSDRRILEAIKDTFIHFKGAIPDVLSYLKTASEAGKQLAYFKNDTSYTDGFVESQKSVLRHHVGELLGIEV